VTRCGRNVESVRDPVARRRDGLLMRGLRAARANRIFCTEESVRAENPVLIKTKNGGWAFYQIVDCARMVLIRAQSTIRADGIRPRISQSAVTLNRRFGKH